MFDGGSSCYMVDNAALLKDLGKIFPVPIGLVNGMYTIGCEEGSMVIGAGLELQIVLFVLKLNCNLISISKLCK